MQLFLQKNKKQTLFVVILQHLHAEFVLVDALFDEGMFKGFTYT